MTSMSFSEKSVTCKEREREKDKEKVRVGLEIRTRRVSVKKREAQKVQRNKNAPVGHEQP